MNRLPSSALACVAVLLVSGPLASATSPALPPAPTSRKVDGGTEKRFKILDADHNGKVTQAEYNAGFARVMLAQYDTDHNGFVSLPEWQSVERARGNKVQEEFKSMDVNRDGKLSQAELSSGPGRDLVARKRFAKLDLNGDLIITAAEARTSGIRRESDRDPANHP